MTRLVLALIAATVALVDPLPAGARPSPADLPSREEVRRMVVQEAMRSERVPPSLALAVAEAESDFVADALSPVGARGVMQIMPATARGEFGVEADELWNPRLNIQLGVAFLDQLIRRYAGRWDLALSHYNGGSRVGSGKDARVIPATRPYVDKVLSAERRYARDETVRRLAERAEDANTALARHVQHNAVPDRTGRSTADRSARRARYLALADSALDAARARYQARLRDPDQPAVPSRLLERIAERKARFRRILAGG